MLLSEKIQLFAKKRIWERISLYNELTECKKTTRNTVICKKIKTMNEVYEIEIHDITTNSISVYVHKANSFYDAFLTAKAIKRIYNNNWNRKTEIIRIEKNIPRETSNK